MTAELLTKLKIVSTGSEAQFRETHRGDCLGQSELWSSANLYRQFNLLERLVPRMVCNDLSIFLLLAYSARPKQALVHGLTHSSSAHLQCYRQINAWLSTWNTLFQPRLLARRVSTLSGFVDYTAIVASQRLAGKSVPTCLNRQVHCFLQLFF